MQAINMAYRRSRKDRNLMLDVLDEIYFLSSYDFQVFNFSLSLFLPVTTYTTIYIYIHIFGWIITSYNDRTSTSSEWWSVGVPMPVSEGNQSVPTTFDDMFCFNAAVMGLENRDWMHLGSFGWLRKHPQNRPEVEKWCSSTLQGA